MDDRSRSASATDVAVQLNCLSDSRQYDNTSSCFTNNMNPPILLPFHTPYEVGLSNIYFKEDFYQLLANDEESCIQIVFYILTDKSSLSSTSDIDESTKPNEASLSSTSDIAESTRPNETGLSSTSDIAESTKPNEEGVGNENIIVIDQKILQKVYPTVNLVDDIKTIINDYNSQLHSPMMQYDELNMKIKYNLTSEHVYHLMTSNSVSRSGWFSLDLHDDKYGAVALKFGRNIANYLGYYPNRPFFIFCESNHFDVKTLNQHTIKSSSSFGSEISNPISNIFVYTNIVKRSRTGSQNTNLLEVIPFNTFSKKNSITIYKEVSQYDIQYIKIQLTDEYGKNIPFLDNTYVAVELHFRPKI